MFKKTLIAGVAATALFVPGYSVAQDNTAASAEKVEFIQQQKVEETLASRMIGASVQNETGEDLGDINDLVIGANGEVGAAVIGVGGFLGIGEKNVAVSYDNLNQTMDGDEFVVTLNTTKAELEAAPDYVDVDNKPLSVSKRWTDQAKETYSKAKDQASEAYNQAKKKVNEATEEESTTQ